MSSTAADPSTRDRIAAVAAPLFADRGFAGVSMRDIAQAVGVKAASLYNHYSDKDALYAASLEGVFVRRAALVEEATAAARSLEEQAEGLVDAVSVFKV